jgi:SNF2 family DNA or RNA helicase
MAEEPEENFQTHVNTWDGRGLLNLLNLLFKNSLSSESSRAEKPASIKIQPRPHQLAVLSAMEKMEQESITGRVYREYKTFSNFGFIADEVGTGKSLMVLSHIARMKNATNTIETNTLQHSSCGNLFTIKTHVTKNDDATLLVVPHTIFRQWQTYIKDHTTLKVFSIKSKANLIEEDDNKFLNLVKESDLVLVSNTLYSETMDLASKKKISWKRIFFDEADSIHITSTSKKPNAGFIWFISASWANFLFHGSVLRSSLLTLLPAIGHENPNLDQEMCQWVKNEIGVPNISDNYGYHSVWLKIKSPNFFRDYLSNNFFRSLQLIRCRKEFIEESMTMPPINNIQIMCEQPPNQRIVNGLVSRDIQQMLHAGDIEGALDKLGVKAEEPTTLLDAFMSQQNKELDRLKKTYAFKEAIEYESAQAKTHALNTLKSKISSIEEQMKTFKDRIDTLKDEVCPICYDDLTNTTMTPCCHRAFCGTCMLTSLAKADNCPMCRSQISANKLIHVSNKKVVVKDKKKNIYLRKPEALLDFIVKNPSAKILVFSRYENPFATLSIKCEDAGIDVFILKGNKDCIANTIKEFESGNKRVLFLPTESAAAGMNLIAASHIVIYHAMTPEEERQVIGRAYRLGRKEPLSVVRLVHEAETSIS